MEAARNSIQEAADRAGVALAEFRWWLLEHATVNSQRWSKWNHGAEPVPDRYIIDFLREKLRRAEKMDPAVAWAGITKGRGIKERLAVEATLRTLRDQLHDLAEALQPEGEREPNDNNPSW